MLRASVEQAVSTGKTCDYKIKDDLLYRGQALYVPDDAAVKAQLIRMHHDDVLARHFGQAKVKELILRKYW
jgi:hypothetical protein